MNIWGKLLTILAWISVNSLFGQNNTENCISFTDSLTKIEVYSKVDKLPSVQGGDELLYNELNKLELPSCGHYSGKIWVAFIVDIDGSIKGKRVVRDIEGTDLGEQVLSLIENVKWIPGECNGNKVSVLFRFPMIIDYK